MNISQKELNRLKRKIWYHGTTAKDAENIVAHGVDVNYNVGSELDFGRGFYLTDTFERASNYISRIPEFDRGNGFIERKEWAVMEFEFDPYSVLFETENNYRYCNFPKHDEKFAKFVFRNRFYNVYNEKPHGYDLIWGVMSDSLPIQIVNDYKNHKISYEDALILLQKPNSMKQLFIGNQEICGMLKYVKTTVIKKEDDLNEKCNYTE